jgi:2-oxoisovalerate dehydrogenase E1 component
VLEVYKTVSQYADKIRKAPRPLLLECNTFRRRGHEEASGTKYVPDELMKYWEERDPVIRFEEYLMSQGMTSEEEISALRRDITEEIETNLKIADDDVFTEVSLPGETSDMFLHSTPPESTASSESEELRFVDAVKEGLREGMRKHPELVLMGQDIGDYGGVFKVTEGFVDEFGAERVRNTPLCESAIVGAAIGLSIEGFKSMVEMQFADFVTCGFNQIVNNAAKLHYRWGQNVDVVIRMPTGGGVGAGPFHSQSNEAWFFHVPGLRIVYPSTPEDAKGLLLSALADPNPVLYFEHKALYRNLTGEVPKGYYTVPIGKARTVRTGERAVIITYGSGVTWACEYVDANDLDVEVLDLRSLAPLDLHAINEAVQKTNRVLILHEATLTGGVGAEISAYINEHLFDHLDAPVMRVASLDTPVPFAGHLENQFLPKERFIDQLEKLLKY